MKLSNSDLSNRNWKIQGYKIPAYDRDQMQYQTSKHVKWIHFGAGNLFRAYIADTMDILLNSGTENTGIVAVKGNDPSDIKEIFSDHDNLTIGITLCADGQIRKKVIGSIAEVLNFMPDSSDYSKLQNYICSPTLQLVTFTITEKGYSLPTNTTSDLNKSPKQALTFWGKITALLYLRYLTCQTPLALVSIDNCSENGNKIRSNIDYIGKNWEKQKLVEQGFVDYLSTQITTPWTMIDKITPKPDLRIKELLLQDGIERMNLNDSKTSAPFVNSEECGYLIIEDNFPNGRPSLEKAGVLFTDRTTVSKCEHMKVCTCLNPLHTALAVFGCLFSYTKMSDVIQDPLLFKLAYRIGFLEGLPVVEDPKILKPIEFLKNVLYKRIPNPYLPDTPQRIATDTSQKLSIRFGETLKSHLKDPEFKYESVIGILLVYAGWIRYLQSINDDGVFFSRSSDPLLDKLDPIIADIPFCSRLSPIQVKKQLDPILKQESIFGVDLVAFHLDDLICQLFIEMNEKPGSIRNVLSKYLNFEI